jgi:hypothetical protein
MRHYVTHQFAHTDTLARAERWLLQIGFVRDQIESHREGVPWLSVLVTPGRSGEAESVFNAAELTDPGGWPSFWELAQLRHPRAPAGGALHASPPRGAGRTPIGWHPSSDEHYATREGLDEALDVFVRFA